MLIPLSNTPRASDWGSPTLLADLEGRQPDGSPEAEVWFGDHPMSPSLLGDGSGRTLDGWLATDSAGTGAPERLPYLLKLLAAASPLSIQAHPSKAQAAQGFASEEAEGIPRDAPERNYRDDNHKPELIVALTPEFEALSGIRDLAATARLLAELGDGPGVSAVAARLADGTGEAVAATIGWLLSGDASAEVSDVVAALEGAHSAEFEGDLEAARGIAARFPGDPGVVVALLMNRVVLRRGEAVYVEAGLPHAYLAGLGVELMAASDNVLRGGLTSKYIDVPELLTVLDARPAPVRLLPPMPVPSSEGDVTVYAPGIPDFELLRVVVGEQTSATVPLTGIAIALSTTGVARVEGRSGGVDLIPGKAVLVTADEAPLRVSGDGEVFIAQPGA